MKHATIKQWLGKASGNLKNAGIETHLLDAQLILGRVLGQQKIWLLAHPEEELSESKLNEASFLLKRRSKHEPIAYILGYQEFYKRNFIVNSNVLIPRPETELLIEYCTQNIKEDSTVLDIGTGSGCIAITLKLEKPHCKISAYDISEQALMVAKQNAKYLNAEVKFEVADAKNLPIEKFDWVIANLPYVSKKWNTSKSTRFEPNLALYAEDNGLELIFAVIDQAQKILNKNGTILLEADPRQHEAIANHAKNANLKIVVDQDFLIGFKFIA